MLAIRMLEPPLQNGALLRIQRSHDSNDNCWPLNTDALVWDLLIYTETTKRLMGVDELPQNIYFTSNVKKVLIILLKRF